MRCVRTRVKKKNDSWKFFMFKNTLNDFFFHAEKSFKVSEMWPIRDLNWFRSFSVKLKVISLVCVKVVKNRYAGDLGSIPLTFNKPTLTFSKKVADQFKRQARLKPTTFFTQSWNQP